MHFAFTQEQEQLRATVLAMLARRPAERPRAPEEADPGFDAVLWRRLAGELGAQALAVPEEYGGHGFGLLESNLVVEALADGLVHGPFLGSAVIAAHAVLAAGDPAACARLLPGIATGRTVAALAWAEHGGWWRIGAQATTATRRGDAWSLDGDKVLVLDGEQADVVLVVAETGRGPALFELDRSALAGSVRRETPMDSGRRSAALRLVSAPAVLVGAEGRGAELLARTLDVACAAIAAEQVGAAARCLRDTVAYTKVRVQFGRPIGAFQAVKHRLADLYVRLESARSLSYAASWAVAVRSPDAAALAAAAKSYGSQAYAAIAAEGVQLHGGIGVTWEHGAHLHLKRAHATAQLFGDPVAQRVRLGGLIGVASNGSEA
ncbi:acyl-CoA dehydrogenase family protein [Solihabitans fulvus]|uniref:acyl-CoA dehydrogenase family protein n=1 Tax=Solihabitans fulvus TaxID=1892852 RepID=UPI001CB75F00|nr:acyl-CoA dehydrogenase family protein [Solihabitans fulvus]